MARMFPAYKPHEIQELPAKYYLAMREYYIGVKRSEAKAMSRGQDPDLEVPGFTVVDFDKNVAAGKPI